MELKIEEKIRLFNGDGSWKTYSANGKIPQIFMSDGPHGLRKQDFENYKDLNASNIATCFPTASCVASSWDEDLLAKLGAAIGKEALSENVNLVLGPGINIKRSPLCGRNFEYLSEDALVTGRLAAAYVNGMQCQGVGACLKHYACNNQEKRRQTSSSNVDEQTLRQTYLRAFEYVVKNAKPAAIMSSYNKVNGTYTCHNRHLLTEILRDEWKYEGVVISDWGGCINAPECLKAGMDLAMPDSFGYIGKQLKHALDQGTITEAQLDTANSRLISFIKKWQQPENTNIDRQALLKENDKLALQLAQNSAVLLKNDGILPLTTHKITIIGELAEFMKIQGGGSSHISTAPLKNAIEAFTKAGYEVTYEKGYFSGFCKRSKAEKKNTPYIARALETVRHAAANNEPVLLFCGLTDAFEGEGFDRSDMELPPEQLKLISQLLEITQNVIVVSFSGAPVDLQPAAKARAILQMYLAGQACAPAIESIISGTVNPSGRLAETWPLKIEDTPSYKNFSLEGDEINYTEGNLVGYRWYNQKQLPVQFPFGFGLSYTTFQTTAQNCKPAPNGVNEALVLEAATVPKVLQVSVSNTGKRDGATTVQIYDRNLELLGFKKVFVQAGQMEQIEIELEQADYSQFGGQAAISAGKKENQDFNLTSSLGDMAKASRKIRNFLKVIELALKLVHKGRSREDPSVKIEIAAIYENPLESLISTSGGIINEKFANRIVKWANGGKK